VLDRHERRQRRDAPVGVGDIAVQAGGDQSANDGHGSPEIRRESQVASISEHFANIKYRADRAGFSESDQTQSGGHR
jgi:hypothetical protein